MFIVLIIIQWLESDYFSASSVLKSIASSYNQVTKMSDKFISVRDFENYAIRTLPRTVLGYYQSGSCEEYTLSINNKAFNK